MDVNGYDRTVSRLEHSRVEGEQNLQRVGGVGLVVVKHEIQLQKGANFCLMGLGRPNRANLVVFPAECLIRTDASLLR